MGSLEVNLTYFMTPKVNLTFDLDLDLKVMGLLTKGQAFGLAGDHKCPAAL